MYGRDAWLTVENVIVSLVDIYFRRFEFSSFQHLIDMRFKTRRLVFTLFIQHQEKYRDYCLIQEVIYVVKIGGHVE